MRYCVSQDMTPRIWRWWAASAVVMIGLACAPADGRSGDASSATPAGENSQARLIDHLTPRRDSVGRAPEKFEWTKIEGADSYSIGLWNEVDVMVWRQDRISENHLDRPKDLELEAGTYLWTITALRGNEPIAESGLAAFVVRTDP